MAFDAADFAPITKTALEDFRQRLSQIDPALFDMGNPAPACETAACFCGWARAIYFNGKHEPRENVSRRLGLRLQQGADLFWMGASDEAVERALAAGINPLHANLAQGLRVLDHLIATGEVDWFVARTEPV